VSGILFAFLLILFSFGLGFYLFEALLQRYGAAWGIHSENDWGALPILVLVLSVVSFFSEPLENAFSRRHEHAADVYGEEVVHGIVANPQATGRAAFQLLGENSFDYPFPSKFYDFWTGSHPPTWFRAAFAKDYDPWAAGEAPKYFKK
jgi:Zn-dependent protease with chaperone function